MAGVNLGHARVDRRTLADFLGRATRPVFHRHNDPLN